MDDDNVAFSFRSRDLADKTIYLVASAVSDLAPNVTFSTVYSVVPPPVIDNSYTAKVALYVMITAVLFIISVKSLELAHSRIKERQLMEHRRDKAASRLGINFREDRDKLVALATKTKANFANDIFTNRSLFRK